MTAENRLSAEQLAALAPGDPVVIETGGDSRQPRRSPGTVVRITATHLVVTCRSPRGVAYVHQFCRKNGVRIGGGHVAQLVNLEGGEAVPSAQRRQMLLVEFAYREWSRDRANVEKLRRLQGAINECCLESTAAPIS